MPVAVFQNEKKKEREKKKGREGERKNGTKGAGDYGDLLHFHYNYFVIVQGVIMDLNSSESDCFLNV